MALFILGSCGNANQNTAANGSASTAETSGSNASATANGEDSVAALQDKNAGDTAVTATAAVKDSDQKATTSKTTAKSATTNTSDDDAMYCTLYITCASILDHMDDFDSSKEDLLPSDGVIYKEKKVEFAKGDTVFDVLQRETKSNKIHMEFTKTPIYKSNYIEGINNIYEFDCGPLSGWMYSVNGSFPQYGCSGYKLKNGDKIKWIYSCELGRDIGAPEWKEGAAPSE